MHSFWSRIQAPSTGQNARVNLNCMSTTTSTHAARMAIAQPDSAAENKLAAEETSRNKQMSQIGVLPEMLVAHDLAEANAPVHSDERIFTI